MLFQKGIAIDDNGDDDLYSMLVPGESDQVCSSSNAKQSSSNGSGNNNKSVIKKPNNIRSPF